MSGNEMIIIATSTRHRDAIRAAHAGRGSMIRNFFRALRG
jgi:hypothetical protein